MSEKIPQSNPESFDTKRYLIPIAGDKYVFGTVNADRLIINASKHRNGQDIMIRLVEVAYEVINPDGETMTETKMISDHLLADDVQADFRKKYFNTTDKDERG